VNIAYRSMVICVVAMSAITTAIAD